MRRIFLLLLLLKPFPLGFWLNNLEKGTNIIRCFVFVIRFWCAPLVINLDKGGSRQFNLLVFIKRLLWLLLLSARNSTSSEWGIFLQIDLPYDSLSSSSFFSSSNATLSVFSATGYLWGLKLLKWIFWEALDRWRQRSQNRREQNKEVFSKSHAKSSSWQSNRNLFCINTPASSQFIAPWRR